MQILGKRSKILLTALCAVMLIAVGISFAAWDLTAVKADGGNMSNYANAKVGDIVTFGNYYKNNADENGVFKKSPLEWLVVDKNERDGELTLMTRYIIACGSYFGNYYDDGNGASYGWHYNPTKSEIANIPYNQAYCDSTVRAYLNNLERMDLGGDQFIKTDTQNNITGGYIASGKDSTLESGLLSSIGFSNKRYWTGLSSDTFTGFADTPGFHLRSDIETELYYQRPINDAAYAERPIAKGFFDEAFTNEEKSKIVPKVISGYTGHRWPDKGHDVSAKSYIEGTVDKVWIPSATELNVMNGHDWTDAENDLWTNPTDEVSSTVFEYFKNYSNYKNPYTNSMNGSLQDALKGQRTSIARNGKYGSYSIPVYKYRSGEINTDINPHTNTSDNYWTRSPMSYYTSGMRPIKSADGNFQFFSTYCSDLSVRPCIILQY